MTKKLLIVDDEDDILELLTVLFSDLDDCCVLRAHDGEEAMRMVRDDNPDIMLLDIQLPKVNGYEVCRAVKSDKTKKTKVLMLSGVAQNADRAKARKAGADAFITKPFNSNTLVKMVKEFLEKD